MRHCSYMLYIDTLLYLLLDFRVAYATNISEHLTIRWEIDQPCWVLCHLLFSNTKELLVMWGQSSFQNKPIKPYSIQECIGLFAKWDSSMLRNGKTPPVLLKTVDLCLEMPSDFNCDFCFVIEGIFELGNTTKSWCLLVRVKAQAHGKEPWINKRPTSDHRCSD